jgi:hypothetical protein
MEVFLRLENPIKGIELVEIFDPVHDDFGTFLNPVNIDGTIHTFLINENGVWEIREAFIVPQQLIDLISAKIESRDL